MGSLANVVWVFALGAFVAGCAETVRDSTYRSVLLEVFEQDVDFNFLGNLEGVEVCQGDTTNCVVTDANGKASLELPVDDEFFLTFDKDGYEAFVKVDRNDEGFVGVFRQNGMWSDETATDWYEAGMQQYPPTGVGTVYLIVFPGREGATFELVDATGEAFYTEGQAPWTPRFDLEATTSRGEGGFFEVVPGEFQIEIGGTARDCAPTQAWSGDAENRIRFPVREGFITILRVDCPVP